MEIYQQFRSQNNIFSINTPYEAGAVLFSIYREDMILSDEVAYQFTTRPREGFATFSVNFRKKFGPGYGVGPSGCVVPNTAKTLSLQS